MDRAIFIHRNAFTENVGSDWVAIDGAGHPVARASDEASVRRAAPNASYYLTGTDLDPAVVAIASVAEPEPKPEPPATFGQWSPAPEPKPAPPEKTSRPRGRAR